jgi:sugar lactone lactonase YvrE
MRYPLVDDMGAEGRMETLELSPFFEGLRFGEGPRWHDGRRWLSDIPNGRVLAVDDDGQFEFVVETEGRQVLFFLDLADRAARSESIRPKVDPFGDEDELFHRDPLTAARVERRAHPLLGLGLREDPAGYGRACLV